MSPKSPSLPDLVATLARTAPRLDAATDARIKARLDEALRARAATARRRADRVTERIRRAGEGRTRRLGFATCAFLLGCAVTAVAVMVASSLSASTPRAPQAHPAQVAREPAWPSDERLEGERRYDATAGETISLALDAGDFAKIRLLGERALFDAMSSDDPEIRRSAWEALRYVKPAQMVAALDEALDGGPESRARAGHLLVDTQVPEATHRLRKAMQASDDALKVYLASSLFRLGDPAGQELLQRAIHKVETRLIAAIALAEAGDLEAHGILSKALSTTPREQASWWQVAAVLLALGDGEAERLLEEERLDADDSHKVAAAELLAMYGDEAARGQLAQMAADAAFPLGGEAALALARLRDERAIGWVKIGLASSDARERQQALFICAIFPKLSSEHAPRIIDLAKDPDPRVRTTAMATAIGIVAPVHQPAPRLASGERAELGSSTRATAAGVAARRAPTYRRSSMQWVIGAISSQDWVAPPVSTRAHALGKDPEPRLLLSELTPSAPLDWTSTLASTQLALASGDIETAQALLASASRAFPPSEEPMLDFLRGQLYSAQADTVEDHADKSRLRDQALMAFSSVAQERAASSWINQRALEESTRLRAEQLEELQGSAAPIAPDQLDRL